MKPNLDDISDQDLAAELAARLTRAPKVAPEDWLSAYERGEILLADEAAACAGVSVDTIRRWCAASVDVGEPIGVLIAGMAWLIALPRLLTTVEQRKGRRERDAAEERAKRLRSRLTNLQPYGHAPSLNRGSKTT